LLHIAFLDLLHESFAAKKIGVEVGGELAGHDEKLIADDFGKRNGAARGNKMRSPLEHQASVPESEDCENSASGGESSAAGAEKLSGAVEENGQAKNEKRSEGNEKAVTVGRDAGPIGVKGNEKVKSEKGGKKRSAGAALPPPEDEKASDGEKKNGRPGKQAVIGREKHR